MGIDQGDNSIIHFDLIEGESSFRIETKKVLRGNLETQKRIQDAVRARRREKTIFENDHGGDSEMECNEDTVVRPDSFL